MPAQSDITYKADNWRGSSHYKLIRSYNPFLARVRALAGKQVKVAKAGSVTYDKYTYTILSLSYTPPKPVKKRVLLVGGAHGDEPAGPEAILAFFRYVKKNPKKYADIAIDAIPMMNPWGWTHSKRYTGDGYDMNRDFVLFVTKEAQIVRDITRDKKYDLAIDHHEASQSGAFIYTYTDGDEIFAEDLINTLRKNGYAIATSGNSRFRWGLFDGVVRIPAFSGGSFFRNRSTIARYFNEGEGTRSYTMETSVYKKFNNRIDCHFFVMEYMIGEL